MDYTINPRLWKKKSKELEQYLNAPIADIERQYSDIRKSEQAIESSLYNSSDSAAVNSFYQNTARYLYELLHWESSFQKQEVFQLINCFLKKYKAEAVLDFGAGIGGLVLYLRKHGIQCDYLDIKGKTFYFAKWRFDKSGSAITMFDGLQGYPQRAYSCVIAYDMLEHVPNLEETLHCISCLIEKGGFFLVKPTFSGGGIHLKRNEKYQDMRAFNSLLADEGLVYSGRLKKSFLSRVLNICGIRLIAGFFLSKKNKYGGNFLVYRKAR